MDRRIRKTKKQLKDALLELMKEKSIRDISVKELTENADVNRGTFYLHYKDIFALVECLEQEMFEEFDIILNSRDGEEYDFSLTISILIDMFKFIAENAQMCIAFFGPNGDIGFMDRIKALIKERCLKDWMSYYTNADPKTFDYYYAFIVSGCVELLMKWLNSGMHESPENMASMAGQMILHGIKVLQ